jgi:hypothetical protein
MRILNRKKQLEQERLLRAAAKAKAAAAAAAPAADGAASGSAADASSAAAASAAPAAQEAPSPFAAPPGQLELPAEFIEVISRCFYPSWLTILARYLRSANTFVSPCCSRSPCFVSDQHTSARVCV